MMLNTVSVFKVSLCIDWPSACSSYRSYIPEVRIMSIPNLRYMKVSVFSGSGMLHIFVPRLVHSVHNIDLNNGL